jgi:hypothetical protein
MLRILLLIGFGVLAAGVATAAGNYYRYQTDSGSIAFTDELERVPAKYRDDAVAVAPKHINDYDRMTVTAPGASTTAAPSLPRVDAAPEAIAAPGVPTITLEVSPGVFVDVAVDGADKVKVRQGWIKAEDGRVFPYTRVTQGKEVLVDIRDELKPQDDSSYAGPDPLEDED